MKKKLTNVIALTLASCMALSACGSEPAVKESNTSETSNVEASTESQVVEETTVNGVNKTGYPIVDEAMSLSVLCGMTEDVTSADQCDIYNEIAELTNVDVDWELMTFNVWTEKKGVVFARKELPDILHKVDLTDTEYLELVDVGKLVAIDEYFEYTPNFVQVLENSPGLKEAITAEDGHIYAFPYAIGHGAEVYDCSTNKVTYINKKWLDAVGMDIPKTTEDLKNVLVAFKEQDPNGNGKADEIPLTVLQGIMTDWFGAFGIVPNANEYKLDNLTIMDGEVTYAATRDEYRAALDYFHELWDLGVIDPEAFTQDSAMFNGKLKSETRVAGMFEVWRGTSWRLSNEDDEYAILPALTGPNGDCMYPENYAGLKKRASTMVTTDCENIELAMRWIDTLIDPKYAYQFWSNTREGVHYTDNGGVMETIMTADQKDPVQAALVDMRLILVDPITVAKQPRSEDPFNVNNEKAVSDAIYKPFYPEQHYPNVFLTVAESEAVADITAELKIYMDQFYANWIINGGDDAAWEAHLKQLEKLGVNEWIEVYAGAYERYKAASN